MTWDTSSTITLNSVACDLSHIAPTPQQNAPPAVTILLAALAHHHPRAYYWSLQIGHATWQFGQLVGYSEYDLQRLWLVGLLHDVGYIHLPRSLLQKTTALSRDERLMLQTHPQNGTCLIQHEPELGSLATAILAHHERPDGQGYPHQLRQSEIPKEASVLAVVDAVTTMVVGWRHVAPMNLTKIRAVLSNGAGTAWDRDVVQAFVDLMSGRRQSPYDKTVTTENQFIGKFTPRALALPLPDVPLIDVLLLDQ